MKNKKGLIIALIVVIIVLIAAFYASTNGKMFTGSLYGVSKVEKTATPSAYTVVSPIDKKDSLVQQGSISITPTSIVSPRDSVATPAATTTYGY